jgi:predicted XRE-type DNA-binding protein
MTRIEKSSGNVYADLGYKDAGEMQVKACLADKISVILKQRHLTQAEAALILNIPQPKLSVMLRGQFRGISEAKMLDCLNRLGRDVDIVIRGKSGAKGHGRTCVVIKDNAVA